MRYRIPAQKNLSALNLPKSQRARGIHRVSRFVLFFGILIALLFGSYRNQFAELFPSLIGEPAAKVASNATSPSAVAKNPTVVKLGNDQRSQFDRTTTGAISGAPSNAATVATSASKLPTIVRPGSQSNDTPIDPRLPQVVKPGQSIVTAALIQPERITVVDGDTIRVDNQSYRLAGIDTPESGPRAQCLAERDKAARATLRVRELVAGGDLKLDRVACACAVGTEGTQSCNHGRFCGVLTAGGRNVGQLLISEGLAKKYNCGSGQCPPKQSWCS
jgi:endonuclease YncB( thermonuclease family)